MELEEDGRFGYVITPRVADILTGNSTARQLAKDLTHAKKQYIEKRDHFIGLCELNESRVAAWTAMDRSPRVDPRGKKNVFSVYTHNHEKGELSTTRCCSSI